MSALPNGREHSLRNVWLALAGAAALSLFWVAVFFPAAMSPDSIDQWTQAVSWRLTDWHPIGMTLVMRAIHVLCGRLPMDGQVAAAAFLQGTLFWASIFLLIGMAKLRVRTKIVLAAAAALYYPIWPYTVTLWKDVWMAIGFCVLLWILRRPLSGMASGWKLLASLTPAVLMILLQRQTAAVSYLVLILAWSPLVAVRFGRRKLLSYLTVCLLALASAVALKDALYALVRVRPAGNLLNLVLLYEVAGTAKLAAQPYAQWRDLQTARVLGPEKFARVTGAFHCGDTVDYLVFRPGRALALDEVLTQRYAVDDLPRMILRHPAAYLRQRTCSVIHLLGADGGPVHYPFHTGIAENAFGIRQHSLLPGWQRIVVWWEYGSANHRIVRLPFRHWLLLLASLLGSLSVLRMPDRETKFMSWYLLSAGLAILFPLLLITPAADWRYLMPADICWLCGTLITLGAWYERMRRPHALTGGRRRLDDAESDAG